MNIVDIIIILFILLGGIVGFKRGSLRQLVSLGGFAVVVIISFMLKTPLAQLLCKIMPFFTFKGQLAGITVLNILAYEIIAFLIILSVLTTLLQVLIMATNILEKIITLTFIFSIPSKIIGFILGLIENYIVVFIVLYILTFPVFQFDVLKNSKLKDKIIDNTPILHIYIDKTKNIGNEFLDLKDKYKNEPDNQKLNLDALDLLLKYKITDVKLIDSLVDSDKLKVNNIESVLKNYRD